MHFFFNLFQNVSFAKTEHGKVINVLGLIYDVSNSLVPTVSLPHESRQKIVAAADTALATVAHGELNIAEVQRALGL